MCTSGARFPCVAVPAQVAHIDVSRQSPCAAGQVICFSLYGGPEVDVRADPAVGVRQNMIWVDTLLGNQVWPTAAQPLRWSDSCP